MVLITKRIDALAAGLLINLRQNLYLVAVLAAILLAAYGFELFNLNLTIDEEVHAFSSQTDRWIEQGRWGMYFLNTLLIPQPVIPFVPLFTALAFHLFAILLLLNSWGVESKLEKVLVGGIGVAYPGMAYMYTFSTINFGIGIGLFFVAFALFIYVKAEGRFKLLAALPAALSIAIYQGFTVALVIAFLIQFISVELKSNDRNIKFKNLFSITLIALLSVSIYYTVQKTLLWLTATNIGYVDTFFDLGYLLANFGAVSDQVFATMLRVYSGSPSIYGTPISILTVTVVVALAGTTLSLIRCKLSIASKIFIALLCCLLIVLPFASGFFMRGTIAMRFLVSLPIAFSGLIMLGMQRQSRGVILFAASLVTICVFQFATSTNALFSSSGLALEADRVLAGMLLDRIADAKGLAGTKELKYLEVVGFIERPPTRLIPKSETFGASFFEWDQGNVNRILLFLKTLGYQDLQALPLKDRSEMMEQATAMPNWPDKESVRVFGTAVIVKFGPYSYVQTQAICGAVKNPIYCH
ncbi:MAG: hypothetical protein JWM78_2886 [Verrucomicrobiaceae bacterium]|nr:hypothetical protein [Verrucomicrobiaceae bacterium]